MIVSGGENIASSEIERVLYEHDSVLEAAVVGRPDARWGEVPVAFVALRPGADATPDALIAHCQAQLARFKVPKEVTFVEALPRNPSGKVLKRELAGRQLEHGECERRRHDATCSGPVTGGKGWPFGAAHGGPGRGGLPRRRVLRGGRGGPLRSRSPAPSWGGTVAGRSSRSGRAAYKTRLVVMRPVDAAAFNGTVVVLWNNVSAGYENFTGGDSPEVFENGYAYVAASVQRVGIHGQPDNPQGLRDWDPERYGSLSIPSDDYSFDIYTQVAESGGARSAPGRPRPHGRPATVRRIVAQGASQSAARLASYLNGVQPLTRRFDAFFLRDVLRWRHPARGR